jgi:hypothetical protein
LTFELTLIHIELKYNFYMEFRINMKQRNRRSKEQLELIKQIITATGFKYDFIAKVLDGKKKPSIESAMKISEASNYKITLADLGFESVLQYSEKMQLHI